jgi:hypothetical protein
MEVKTGAAAQPESRRTEDANRIDKWLRITVTASRRWLASADFWPAKKLSEDKDRNRSVFVGTKQGEEKLRFVYHSGTQELKGKR